MAIGCWPVARSMIESRAWASPADGSRYRPNSSGPRWRSAADHRRQVLDARGRRPSRSARNQRPDDAAHGRGRDSTAWARCAGSGSTRRLASMSRKTRSTCSSVSPMTGPDLGRRDPVVHRPTGTGPSPGTAGRSRTPPGSGRGSTCPSSACRALDLRRHLEVLSEREDLGLVEVGDRLEVRGPVPLLDEEPLVVLDEVRRAGHGEVEPIGVVVLHHLPRSLLEVRGRHHLEVGGRRHAGSSLVAIRVRDGQLRRC